MDGRAKLTWLFAPSEKSERGRGGGSSWRTPCPSRFRVEVVVLGEVGEDHLERQADLGGSPDDVDGREVVRLLAADVVLMSSSNERTSGCRSSEGDRRVVEVETARWESRAIAGEVVGSDVRRVATAPTTFAVALSG